MALPQWTVDRLTEADEAAVIRAFVEHVDGLRRARGLGWQDVRLVHWWAHETSTYETAYNSARARHGGPDWQSLPWFDFLTEVVRPVPVTVRGAFDFSLKSLAKAMHAAGLIETTWGDGPTDGMGAMVGAWWCDAEAARVGGSMRDLELMREIERYNEVDCRVMAELVGWLRANWCRSPVLKWLVAECQSAEIAPDVLSDGDGTARASRGRSMGTSDRRRGRRPLRFWPPDRIGDVRFGAPGTHAQPPGTWSDDGALMLAVLDSLLRDEALRSVDGTAFDPAIRRCLVETQLHVLL